MSRRVILGFAWLLSVAACSGTVSERPRSGDGGDGGASATGSAGKASGSAGSDVTIGGDTSNGGKASNAGASGSLNFGGDTSPAGNTGDGGTAEGGSAADGGATSEPNGGASEGGAGGAPGPVGSTVHGTVIDFWGHALGNISVKIDDQLVATDKDGKFTAEDVAAEYDASLNISREQGGKIYGWVYQGLTRRDPTLQVYQGRDDRSTSGYLYVSGATLGASDTISASLGTPDGSSEKAELSTSVGGNYFAPDWQGAATTQGTIHALQWSVNQATLLPSAYKAYYSALLALTEGTQLGDTPLTMAGPIVSGSVTGTVVAGDGERSNGVFVRFSSGASIQLVDQTPTANAFSYLVPQLANANISVVASEGDSYGAYGLAHKDGLKPGDAAGTLTIPAPATPLTPNSTGDLVDKTTPFTFSGSVDSQGAFVIHIEALQYYQSVYIVTAKKTFALPTPPGYTWISEREYYWRVETHGSLATVDQMAGPQGFADAYYGPTQATSLGKPQGQKQNSGSFTTSDQAYFTYK